MGFLHEIFIMALLSLPSKSVYSEGYPESPLKITAPKAPPHKRLLPRRLKHHCYKRRKGT